MKVLNITIAIVLATASGIAISSCQTQAEKDFAAKEKIRTMLPNVVVDVKDGIATLNGTFASENTKDSVKNIIRSVKDVNTVVDMCCISMSETPKNLKPDHKLIEKSANILRDFPGVTASIKDGIISLSGEIKIADWLKLKPMLYALEPRKVMNKMAIK